MAPTTSTDVTVTIISNESSAPTGRLADAELHFARGPLAGLTLIGFGIWERRDGGRHVTLPARQYTVNGEKRSFALLRPRTDTDGTHAIRDRILAAYAEAEQAATAARATA